MCITSYNQKRYLAEAIESVLQQTLRPSEIVIVDDCSTDGSQEIISGYATRYPELIAPIYQPQNRGVARTRTSALEAVDADYVTYVDGDDRFLPAKLDREVKLLIDRSHAQIVFSNYAYITTDGTRTRVWADDEVPPQGDVFCQVFAREFPRGNLFRNELVNYRAWKQIGFYDPNLSLYEDYEMRIRLTKHLRVAYCDAILAEYRTSGMGLSSSGACHHFDSLEYVYRKDMPLLDDVSRAERRHVKRKVADWMGRLARQAAGQALDTGIGRYGVRAQALSYYLKGVRYQPAYLDYKLLLAMLLPRCARRFLRATWNWIRRSSPYV